MEWRIMVCYRLARLEFYSREEPFDDFRRLHEQKLTWSFAKNYVTSEYTRPRVIFIFITS